MDVGAFVVASNIVVHLAVVAKVLKLGKFPCCWLVCLRIRAHNAHRFTGVLLLRPCSTVVVASIRLAFYSASASTPRKSRKSPMHTHTHTNTQPDTGEHDKEIDFHQYTGASAHSLAQITATSAHKIRVRLGASETDAKGCQRV